MRRLIILTMLLLAYTLKLHAQTHFNWDNATLYFLLTDRFLNNDTSNDFPYGRTADPIGGFQGGDLKGITQKINEGYFTDLGVTAIWFSAPYEQIHGAVPGYWNCYPCDQHYAYHGYYALDFTEMDANFGTNADLTDFVDAAHSKGIRVIMDIVLNHVGYEAVADATEFGFGPLGDPWKNPNNSLDPYHADWCNWWTDSNGVSWIRKGDDSSDYCAEACGGGDLTLCLAGLPYIRTEMTTAVALPEILKTKWDTTKEAAELVELDTFFNQSGLPRTPANHIIKWLTDWVREYGIDGFRIDTYKHVERAIWGDLKTQAQLAFQDWKTANPSKVLDTLDFWMVGEWFGHGPDKNTEAATTGKTDALINFNFQGQGGDPSSLDNTYTSYAAIASDPDWNFVSYVSSHDTYMFDRSDLYDAATSLLLSPGAVQIYYGDETNRQPGSTGSDQDTRTMMNWGSMDTVLLEHWQKLGQFRRDHPAIGAGSHVKLGDNPYTFKRDFSNTDTCDLVVVSVGASGSTTIDVSNVFQEGATLRDAYTGDTVNVSSGSVTFMPHANGVILIEQLTSTGCLPTVTFESQPPNAPGDWYDPDSLKVAINATVPGSESMSIFYTTNGTTPTTSSTLYDSPILFNNPTDLDLKAIACTDTTNVCSPVAVQRYLVGNIPGFTVYFKRPASWSVTPKIYYWDAEPQGNLPNGTWPGVDMTAECDDWFSYTFTNILSTNIIFNNGSGGGTNQTNDLFADQNSYYDFPVSQSSNYSMVNGTPNTGCFAPTACFSANPTTGASPLTVNFDASCSTTPSGTSITNYNWDFGDGSFQGSGSNPNHTYTNNGIFTVTLTVTNDSTETDTATMMITIDSSNPITVYFEKPYLLVYPNPTSDELHIQIQTASPQPVEITIHDALGKLIYQNEEKINSFDFQTSVDVSHFPSGVYWLKVRFVEKGNWQVVQFVKGGRF